MAGAMYGYARVSSREQNLDRQLDALQALSLIHIWHAASCRDAQS